jgi:hypothetical protein
MGVGKGLSVLALLCGKLMWWICEQITNIKSLLVAVLCGLFSVSDPVEHRVGLRICNPNQGSDFHFRSVVP